MFISEPTCRGVFSREKHDDIDYNDDDDSLPKPWLDFGPDSQTVALIFQGMSDIASKWHDEL